MKQGKLSQIHAIENTMHHECSQSAKSENWSRFGWTYKLKEKNRTQEATSVLEIYQIFKEFMTKSIRQD